MKTTAATTVVAVVLGLMAVAMALEHPLKVVKDTYPECGSVTGCTVDTDNTTVPTRHQNPDGTLTLSSCRHVPFVGDLCVDITVSPLGSFYEDLVIDLSIDHVKVWAINTTIPNIVVDDGVCVDGSTILEILETVPSLEPYQKLIFQLLDVFGCLPAGLFSICVLYDPCSPSSTDCGCFSLDTQLLYFENYCVLKGVYNLGCIGN